MFPNHLPKRNASRLPTIASAGRTRTTISAAASTGYSSHRLMKSHHNYYNINVHVFVLMVVFIGSLLMINGVHASTSCCTGAVCDGQTQNVATINGVKNCCPSGASNLVFGSPCDCGMQQTCSSSGGGGGTTCGCTAAACAANSRSVKTTFSYILSPACAIGEVAVARNIQVASTDGSLIMVCLSDTTDLKSCYVQGSSSNPTTCFNSVQNQDIGGQSDSIVLGITCKNSFFSCPIQYNAELLCKAISTGPTTVGPSSPPTIAPQLSSTTTTTTSPAFTCATYSSCSACTKAANINPACGWCSSTNVCYAGSASGRLGSGGVGQCTSSNSDWSWSANNCPIDLTTTQRATTPTTKPTNATQSGGDMTTSSAQSSLGMQMINYVVAAVVASVMAGTYTAVTI